MNYAEHIAESRRLTVLRVLAESPGYAANEAVNAEWAENHFPSDGGGNAYRDRYRKDADKHVLAIESDGGVFESSPIAFASVSTNGPPTGSNTTFAPRPPVIRITSATTFCSR